ncbi:type II/IV secretion system protein [Burkholderia sp. Bp8963]|uniref:GspE/PulE family protein n=1 Tax=Burkholderia sp. Bp8963 TaxID=2184547 RepID=UPI000F5A5FC0|nr:GspE/PulE family protein [Burkholderia sp. Bp8963]RQS58014.1 type II/IV secretion system protein [Burkholderia sp. Bp8963]
MNESTLISALDRDLIETARELASRSSGSMISALTTTTGRGGREIVAMLGAYLDWPVVETAHMNEATPAFDLLPLAKALQRGAILLRTSAGELWGVVADPFDADLQVWLDAHANALLQFRLAVAEDIRAYLDRQEENTRAVDGILAIAGSDTRDRKTTPELSFAAVADSSSPAIKLINSTLYDGLKAGASDVHFECHMNGLAVRYRIDGVLVPAASFSGDELAEQAISRLKVLAELDIGERRIPQDGRFRVSAQGREIDLRVSIMPSVHGEDAVIRILDKRALIEAHGSLSLHALGFDELSLQTLRQLADAPHGMLLVTGPTGSGKTTTLYAVIAETHTSHDKIITIEDPVEYQLPGVLQIPVNDKKGLSFARGLRSILRHDPDKIMVGEIRDSETAEIAVQAALTGHLVLTTVHANNVFDVVGRFSHMRIDPYAFVSALNGICAQRLVRLTCARCSQPAHPTAEQLRKAGLRPDDGEQFTFVTGAGCGDCRGTGYRGRRAIAEILILNDEIREMIVEKAPIRQIKEAAYRQGTKTLHQTSLDWAKRGLTTLEEVRRVALVT